MTSENTRLNGTNIEIKARACDWKRQWTLAESIADSGPELIEQTDTFFHANHGRLKLREFADGSAELIPYHRPNQLEPSQSSYSLIQVPNPSALKAGLEASLGIIGVVRKKRHLFLSGQTRIHFDEVEGLGQFIELEVVLPKKQTNAEGERIAQDIMQHLLIKQEDLLERAYIDMM